MSSKQYSIKKHFTQLSVIEKIQVVWLIIGWTGLLLIGLFSKSVAFMGPIPELARVDLFIIWLNVLLILSLVSIFLSASLPNFSRKQQLILGLIVVWYFWLVITAIKGNNYDQSLRGNAFRKDGLVTLLHLVLFAVMTGLMWPRKLIILFAHLIGWGGVVISLLSLINLTELSFPALIYVGFGTPIYLGGYLLVSLPFVWYIIHQLWLRWVAITLVAAAIILSQSTGAMLGLALFFGLLLLFHLKRRANMMQIMALLLIVVSTVVIWTYVDQIDSYEGRPRIMTTLWLASQQAPILGWGYANVDQAFAAVDWPYPVRFDVYVDKAHSHLLEMLVVAGWPGLVFYIAFLGTAVMYLFKLVIVHRSHSRCMLTILIAVLLYIFHSQTNVTSIMEEVIFWFCVGVLIHSLNPIKLKETKR